MIDFFDLHCDTVWKISQALQKDKKINLKNNYLSIDQTKLIKGGCFAQCFAVFIPNIYDNPFERCCKSIEVYYNCVKECEYISPVLNFSDFNINKINGKISSILTLEDGCPLENDLSNVDKLYDLGVRMICILHNYPNCIGYPNCSKSDNCGYVDKFSPNTKDGLTVFGRELVEYLNVKGIIVDISHLSDAGALEVLRISRKPIVASHSNVRDLCGNVRNISKEILYNLADNGGVVGINFVPEFLSEDSNGYKTSERVLEHFKYLKKLIGTDNMGIGTDFDGFSADIQLNDASKMQTLVEDMQKNGFTDNEIEKICYKNALRVFKQNMIN